MSGLLYGHDRVWPRRPSFAYAASAMYATLHFVSHDALVLEAVRSALGSHVAARIDRWYVQQDTYLVASVHTAHPTLRLVVKLEIPGQSRPNRHLDVMAHIATLVRQRTDVPVFEVVHVDASGFDSPWNVLIVTELPGTTWQELYMQVDDAQRADARRQIGRAAAQINSLVLDGFGEFGAVPAADALVALRARAERRIRTPRYRHFMLEVLQQHAPAFASVTHARLTHEDLNPFNLLFEVREGQPVLSGVLDFESAWAGVAESDLARLELWRRIRGPELRSGYMEVAPIADEYLQRRAVLQLLWCLEYADEHPTTEHQRDTDAICAELGIASCTLR